MTTWWPSQAIRPRNAVAPDVRAVQVSPSGLVLAMALDPNQHAAVAGQLGSTCHESNETFDRQSSGNRIGHMDDHGVSAIPGTSDPASRGRTRTIRVLHARY